MRPGAVLLSAAVLSGLCQGAMGAEINPLLSLIADRVMAEVDLDRDRRVARTEFAQARQARFDVSDSDDDERISRDEFKSAIVDVASEIGLAWGDTLFAVMDRDANGLLTREEVDTMGELVFTKADRNADGYVTPAEVHPALASAR